jgi:hypothetical protein
MPLHRACHSDVSAVGFNDTLANRQSQPRARPLSITPLDAIKLVENALALGRSDAYPLIRDLKVD